MELIAAVVLFWGGALLFWMVSRPLLYRLVNLVERRTAAFLEPLEQRKTTEQEPVPPDILAYASNQGEAWARDQVLDRAVELRSRLGSWDKVRRQIAAEEHYITLVDDDGKGM